MSDLKNTPEIYLNNYKELTQRWSQNGGIWAQPLREEAMAKFNELGIPTQRHEEWKYTNLTAFKKHQFAPASPEAKNSVSPSDLAPFEFPNLDAYKLVFVDGFFSNELSEYADLEEGIELSSLYSLMHSQRSQEIESQIGKRAVFQNHPFVAMNTAFMSDGIYIRISKKAQIKKPLHLLFVSSAQSQDTMANSRVLIHAEAESKATVIEDYVSLKSSSTRFTNAVGEVSLEANAHLDHLKITREDESSYHIASLAISQEQDSNFNSHNVCLGGRLTRNDISAHLGGTNIECTLNGLVLGNGEQLIDNHTRIVHAEPHCNSFETYKNILAEKARGVFNGKIYVAQDAQKTDAMQSNQSLVLSDDAIMNTKPELEIYADDVRCTHGATIGQLDDDALFYLRTRGIPEDVAQKLLTIAFAREVIEQLPVEEVKETIEQFVYKKLQQDGAALVEVS